MNAMKAKSKLEDVSINQNSKTKELIRTLINNMQELAELVNRDIENKKSTGAVSTSPSIKPKRGLTPKQKQDLIENRLKTIKP
jgi:hypothetical protein